MAEEALTPEQAKAEKARLKEEKKKLHKEQAEQKKAAKKRAKEIAAEEAGLYEDEENGGGSVFLVTFVIVLIWIAILCLIIKIDLGGFGSNVLAPVLKDVPVIKYILPDSVNTTVSEDAAGAYGGYTDLKEAVDYINELQLELERARASATTDGEDINTLKAEVERLKTFEDAQVEFQRIKTQFYEEVVYADNGPGIDEYKKYYEEMDPATAEYLYKQVAQKIQETDEVKDYAKAYSEMKPKQAAMIFEEMTDNLDLVSRILGVMDPASRGAILGVMDETVAAQITKIMDPEA